MAEMDDLYAALRKADAAGDTDGATKLAAYIKTRGTPAPVDTTPPSNPSEGGGTLSIGPFDTGIKTPQWLDRGLAGAGKALVDTARGAGQMLGVVPQQDIDASRQRDAPLMATTAGRVGNVLGNVGTALPAVLVPGAATIPGAAAVGAFSGLVQPTSGDESRLKNTAIGGALGAGSVVAGQAASALWRGGAAAIEPFTAAGPQKIAGRTIQRFANDTAPIANVTNAPTITGAVPTLAEQTGDVGIARLQDALRSADPQLNNALAVRASQNNASRVNALQTMAGQDGARDFALANRNGTAQQLYGDAFSVVPDTSALTPEQSRSMQTLLRSPAIQSAMKDAQTIAQNSGSNVGPANASGSLEGLHNMKMALDDAYNTAATAGQTAKATSIRSAQSRLVDLMEQISPDYATARQVYAQMSQPVNQMDVAAQIAKKSLSNGTDLTTGAPTINRNALMGAMKDEPALIRQATGRPVANALSDVMTPDQMNMLSAIRGEVDRAGAVATAGNGPGSATAQRLASQNILRQAITPGGLATNPTLAQRAGQAVVDNTLTNTLVGKATNWIYSGIAEPRIQEALATAVLQPEEARAALLAAQQKGITLPNNLATRLLGQARRLTGAASADTARQP